MAIKKKKISDYPESDILTGLWTIGYSVVDGLKKTVKISLDFLKNAVEEALNAASVATNAANSADQAAQNASVATTNADAATDNANDATENANNAAQRANEAAANAQRATSGLWRDVTNMFDIPSQADIKCLMLDDGINKPMIMIHGVDTSGQDNPLTITPQFGYGSYYDRTGDNSLVVLNKVAGLATPIDINISAENTVRKSAIQIPANCEYFDLTYFVGQTAGKASSYTDSQGIVYPFSIYDTPIENFCGWGQFRTINGRQVDGYEIKNIVFGDDYSDVTVIPDIFLGEFGITSIDLSGLKGAINIGQLFMGESYMLQELDLRPLTKLRSIGKLFVVYPWSLRKINIGSLDFSNIAIEETIFRDAYNTSDYLLYADSQQLAENLKQKAPQLSQWTVVLNQQ
jgi:hypothetical protein